MTADDAVIFAETTELLTEALESLKQSRWDCVSCIKTNVQAFDDILDATNASILVCGENVDVMKTFTYLGSVIHELYQLGMRSQSTSGTSMERVRFAR